VTDTHAHLDALEDPDAAVERARAAGVERIVTIGTGIESCRAALALADRHDGVYAALGIDPHQASSPEAARVDELRELLSHPKAVAVGETGLDNFPSPDSMSSAGCSLHSSSSQRSSASPSSSTAATPARRRPRCSPTSAAP
jgi:Tat protein secretion system quality control protein TatD with DNase activity